MPPKGKGKGPRLKRPPKPPRGISDRLAKFKWLGGPYQEPAPETQQPETPQPFQPENIIHGPIRTRLTQKQPSPEWLQAEEVPRRITGKQPEPLWMAVKDQKAEYQRAVQAYRRDMLGRFLGGKGAWA